MPPGVLSPEVPTKSKQEEPLSNETQMPLNAESMNAIVNALGALVFATVRQLPEDKQAAFASDLARLAKLEEKRGDLATETLLLDLHRAATAAAS